MTVTLIVKLRAHPGSGAALRDLLDPLPAENDIPGCLGWEVYSNKADPDEVLLLERWQTAADHKAHLDRAAASGAFDHIFAHVRQAERAYYTEV
jgi:quinol monooxygenase YgiN